MSTQYFDANSVPGIALMSSALNSWEGGSKAMYRSDYDFSQEDLQNFQSLAPNFYGVGKGLEYLEDELPPFSTKPEVTLSGE